ncbi:YXWGXW repeat-containing protein [Candidatus Methylacidithermus pantelleriae]|nr:YXWGXW repeat-containing protein [Candidatus Methylacidithermus pantelleriae]
MAGSNPCILSATGVKNEEKKLFVIKLVVTHLTFDASQKRMKKLHVLLVGIVLGVGALPSYGFVVVATPPPPPPVVVVRPAPPGPGWVWVPGHWVWRGRWVWKHGHWVRRPWPGAVWVPGHWARRPGGWVWVPGHWAR